MRIETFGRMMLCCFRLQGYFYLHVMTLKPCLQQTAGFVLTILPFMKALLVRQISRVAEGVEVVHVFYSDQDQ
jgi:hypothetical protein